MSTLNQEQEERKYTGSLEPEIEADEEAQEAEEVEGVEEDDPADSMWMLALYDFLNGEANTQGGHGL
ncbi:MAG: hypothetical protein SPF89_02350 [Sphaerochaetaceae bacterium]|nr:hypothetical protein [Spirochaetales bacterium]MDY5498927.1 hypothetical protein [Sphaerochaetaceae bacterium]